MRSRRLISIDLATCLPERGVRVAEGTPLKVVFGISFIQFAPK